MLQLRDIANVLRGYRKRYRYLDVFADDVEELRQKTLADCATVLQREPQPMVSVPVDDDLLVIELYPSQGIARCRLDDSYAAPTHAVDGAILGSILGSLLGAATSIKEGLLGGLVLGMLVGGVIGATQPVERVLAMQFEPEKKSWRLYDGPLLRWAKRTMEPAPA